MNGRRLLWQMSFCTGQKQKVPPGTCPLRTYTPIHTKTGDDIHFERPTQNKGGFHRSYAIARWEAMGDKEDAANPEQSFPNR